MKKLLSLEAENILIGIVFFISITVMLGWIFEVHKVLYIIPAAATMKFNTAFLFFLSCLILGLAYKRKRFTRKLLFFLNSLIFTIASFSLIEYFIDIPLDIDNTIIQDQISSGVSGRMSPATSFCFLLLSLGFFNSIQKNKWIKQASNNCFLLVLVISFTSFVSYVMQVPMEHKIHFFQTMAIHTSFSFMILSFVALLRLPSYGFTKFLFGKQAGSKIMQLLLPLLIFMPIAFNYVLLYVFNNHYMEVDFGIALSSVGYVLVSILYVSIVGESLNRSDRERKILENKLLKKRHEELKINLLKETHHRVKNNFQMVNSILRLQSYKFDNKLLISVIEDCQDRIRTMAVLHESMYKYGSYEKVQIRDFFETIIHSLVDSYSGDKLIDIDVSIEPEYLETNTAVPLGLIINEIVTNSLKHAFVDRKEGTIFIRLHNPQNGHFSLIIGDNGVGFDSSKTIQLNPEQTMGEELIEVFTRQINGEIQKLEQEGTLYKLTFKVDYEANGNGNNGTMIA
jgi:two-component sensor histidine kinase